MLLFETLVNCVKCRFQFLHFAMLFEELVEQHRVHGVVAYSGDLAILVPHYEIRIHLGNILCDQSKLRRICDVVLIVEGDWPQLQDSFARFVHRFNLLFKPARGDGRAELATGVDQYWYSVAAYERPENVADKAAIAQVRSGMTDTNNVTSRFDAGAGSNAYGSVKAAGGVVIERKIP